MEEVAHMEKAMKKGSAIVWLSFLFSIIAIGIGISLFFLTQQRLQMNVAVDISPLEESISLVNEKIEAIEEQVESLQQTTNVPIPELNNIISQLALIIKAIPTLPLMIVIYEEVAEKTVLEEDVEWWKKGLKNSWELIKQIIVVRQHDQPFVPILDPSTRAITDNQIITLLIQAQWAATQGNKVVFEKSIEQATALIKQSFDQSKLDTQQVLNTLQSL